MLRNIINQMPTANIHLCEIKSNGEIDQSRPLDLPITDHDIIVGSNKHGVFATWNPLNPDSPVSPGFAPPDVKGLRGIYIEEERQEHITLVAKHIISLFKNGTDALALQEVPAMNGKYFDKFISALEKFTEEEKINLDFKMFKDSYRQTKRPFKNGIEQGYHPFGTALLCKKDAFVLEKVDPILNGRGSSYSLQSTKSKEKLTLINIHGDYGQADVLVEQISSFLSKPNTIIVGDTNVALTKKKAVEQFSNMSGVVVEPSTNVSGTFDDSRTLDCFLTSIPTDFICKEGSYNYAKKKSSKEEKDNKNSSNLGLSQQEKINIPHIIIYPPISRNAESKNILQEKIKNLVKNTDIETIEPQGLTIYQKERAFIYGDKAYGHAAAVICISGEEPIPFGVISADINNKKLPVIVYVENNDKARKIYADFYKFLEDTNIEISKHLKNVDSFHFKKANHVVLYEEESEENNKIKLMEAIQKINSIYLEQSEEKRAIRMESTPPTKDQLDEKRNLFSKKEGFSLIPTSLEEFKSHLDKDKPTISFFGMIFSPITDKCEWAVELGNCNLIYGLGGANKNKPLKEQSVMYQFAHYAKMGGCKIYGTIPFGQVPWEEKLDFSVGIESCYITPQLQERMDAFKTLSQFVIVGSTGTGTYEEIMDTLRTNPLTHLMIMNDDGGNKPLVTFLLENKQKYPNVTIANTRAEFKMAIDNFKKLNLEKSPEKKGEQQKPVTTNSSAFFSPLLEISKTDSIKSQPSAGLIKLI